MNIGIKDRDTKNAIETLVTEFENAEATIADLSEKNEELEDENDDLRGRVVDLELQVQDLEAALAEAHLTGEEDGRDQREDDSVQT